MTQKIFLNVSKEILLVVKVTETEAGGSDEELMAHFPEGLQTLATHENKSFQAACEEWQAWTKLTLS